MIWFTSFYSLQVLLLVLYFSFVSLVRPRIAAVFEISKFVFEFRGKIETVYENILTFFQGPEYRIEKYTRTGRKSFYTLPVREVFGHMLPDTAVPGSNQASRLCSNKKPADRQRIV